MRYIDIDDYVQLPDGEAKTIKTASSRRLVPIHDRLQELGFARYVEALSAAGHTQVFPDLTLGQFGKRTKEASRTAARYIDKHVSRDARLVFHSFRHGFKDLGGEAGISDRVLDRICGHAPTSVGGKYGQGVRLPTLHRALHQIDWSFIDWDALVHVFSRIDWAQVIAASRKAT